MERRSPAATLITHSITVNGPASAVVIDTQDGNVTVNGAAGTPFLSATKLTYSGGIQDARSSYGKCKITTFQDTYGSGSLVVHFDTGRSDVRRDTREPVPDRDDDITSKT